MKPVVITSLQRTVVQKIKKFLIPIRSRYQHFNMFSILCSKPEYVLIFLTSTHFLLITAHWSGKDCKAVYCLTFTSASECYSKWFESCRWIWMDIWSFSCNSCLSLRGALQLQLAHIVNVCLMCVYSVFTIYFMYLRFPLGHLKQNLLLPLWTGVTSVMMMMMRKMSCPGVVSVIRMPPFGAIHVTRTCIAISVLGKPSLQVY